jgi:hypothetical protein
VMLCRLINRHHCDQPLFGALLHQTACTFEQVVANNSADAFFSIKINLKRERA